jgi:hypothetical protein
MSGESNAGGRALNSASTAGELAPRSALQILNNTSLVLEDLDIGTNNLLGHTGLSSQETTEHSMELELANQAAQGEWYRDKIYLVKTGYGGSLIADWGNYGLETYAPNIFARRVANAMQLLDEAGVKYRPVIWMTVGINDAISGTNAETFKTKLVARISAMRDLLGLSLPVFLTTFDAPMTERTGINTVIGEIAAADSNTFVISSSGFAVNADSIHWSYAGQKSMATAFKKSILAKAARYLAPSTFTIVPPKTSLAAWYDAADPSMFSLNAGTQVVSWFDKSGNGRTATQATAANRPGRTGTLNGRPTVTFSTSTNNWLALTYTSWAQRPLTFYAVFKNAKTEAAGTLHSAIFAGGGSNLFIGREGSNDAVLGAGFGTHASVACSTTDWRILKYTQAGGSGNTAWTLTSGANTATGTNGPTYSTASTFSIGGYNNAANVFGFGGQIAEILLYSGVLDAAADARATEYLKAKWAVA